jgi:predicted DNA binding CopG/RHH family protein
MDTRINLALSREQHDALKQKAKAEGISVQGLIRAGITSVTLVPDPMATRRSYNGRSDT